MSWTAFSEVCICNNVKRCFHVRKCFVEIISRSCSALFKIWHGSDRLILLWALWELLMWIGMFPLYAPKCTSNSLVLANDTYLHLMIPKQCKTISESINGSSVFISYEVNLQFCWKWVRSLKGVRSRSINCKKKIKSNEEKLSNNAVTQRTDVHLLSCGDYWWQVRSNRLKLQHGRF